MKAIWAFRNRSTLSDFVLSSQYIYSGTIHVQLGLSQERDHSLLLCPLFGTAGDEDAAEYTGAARPSASAWAYCARIPTTC